MKLPLAVLPGDGVGPEVTEAGLAVLGTVAERWGHELEVTTHPVGWSAVQDCGDPLPAETLAGCLASRAVLLGAVGHPDADGEPPARRPETGLLRLRRELGCYANLRPARIPEALVAASPLRPEIVRGTNLLVVRELGGGIYYGPSSETPGERAANTMEYTADEIRRIARLAFDLARTRRGEVTSIDKANVLAVSRLWRAVVDEVAQQYRDVRCRHMLVDRAAMELVLHPASFDVLLTPNMFGDILSDQAGALVGSLGLLGSASVGGRTDLYEPVHGSAPDIAGRNLANPVGMISSIALMLRTTFGLTDEAAALERAVEAVLGDGHRTADIAAPDETAIGTREFGDLVTAACATATSPSAVDVR